MKITHTSDVITRRGADYPPLEDLADALYWRARGDASKWNSYIAAIDAIKAKYPTGATSVPTDLEIVRQRALEELDDTIVKATALVSKHPPIYLVKERLARLTLAEGTPHPALLAEAAIRGVSVMELATQIVDKADDAATRLILLDAYRLRKKGEILAATSEQALKTLLLDRAS
jgi:hypothetical protein